MRWSAVLLCVIFNAEDAEISEAKLSGKRS
jgi:hypothetical protein